MPAILFDRSIYPRCFGLSEDAFRLFIFECSSINNKSSLHYCTYRAVEKYLGLTEDAYKAAKKELRRTNFIIRYHVKSNKARYTRKYWGVKTPPFILCNEDMKSFRYISPSAEPKTGLSALFHRQKKMNFIRVPKHMIYPKPFSRESLLSQMSIDEIYCYFNVLWQNRECWFGVNPNYIHCKIDVPINFRELTSMYFELDPVKAFTSELCLNQVLVNRTQNSPEKLDRIINKLVYQRKFFRWIFWLATLSPYYERRRDKCDYSLQLMQYLDPEVIAYADDVFLSMVFEEILKYDFLIFLAQLRPSCAINPKFEMIIKNNCNDRRWPNRPRINRGPRHGKK